MPELELALRAESGVSRRSTLVLAWTAVALVVIAGGAWIASNLRWVEQVRDHGFRGEARRNPLLACERLFSAMGLPASSRPYVGALPPNDHALVLRNTGRFLAPATIERLLAWVEAGGNLVMLFPSDDDLMEQVEDDLEAGRFELPVARELGVNCLLDNAPEGVVRVDLGRGEVEIALPGRFAFEDALGQADLVVGEALRARLLSFVRGLGRVTLVADDTWATNDRIAERDHARAMWQLANLEGARAGATIVFSEKPPGLLLLLAKHGWMVIASLAAFLVVYLWRIGSRFGPPVPDPPRGRRDFSEHVVASSEFLWRHGASSALLAAPRSELRRQIGLTRHDLADADRSKLVEALALVSELPPERVGRALDLPRTTSASEFTELVRDLSSMRKSL